LAKAEQAHASTYRLIVVGGHTRSIGKKDITSVCTIFDILEEFRDLGSLHLGVGYDLDPKSQSFDGGLDYSLAESLVIRAFH